jgi:RNA polymerase sigma-70 factor (ECF subfamily)
MSEMSPDFPAIYAEHYPKITRYLRRLVGDADAEDVAQEAFVKISRSLNSFRGESKLSTWIYRIASNTATDHFRRTSSKGISQQWDDAEDGDMVSYDDLAVDGAPLHDTLLIRKDMNECIRGLVDSLPEKYRAVLVLADLEELANGEISEVTGMSLDTVKIRLHRARLQLKKKMDQACLLYRDGRNELSCDRKLATLEFVPR